MIGVLKALGADNFAIRKIFLSFSVFLIGRGMLWGNIIGVALCFIQSQFHLFKLDKDYLNLNSYATAQNCYDAMVEMFEIDPNYSLKDS